MPVILEAVCGSVAEAAVAGLADRIELCAALPTGGVTPSPGMLAEVQDMGAPPIVFMVRSMEGDVCPPEAEFKVLLRDVAWAARQGVDSIICGVLSPDSVVDMDRNRALIGAASGVPCVFHRVFDYCRDLDQALEDAIDCGFNRILTSGGAQNVDLGFVGLKRLVDRSQGRIDILPGGGVREHNAVRLVQEAGCRELHFTFRKPTGRPNYQSDPATEPDPNRIAAMRALTQDL